MLETAETGALQRALEIAAHPAVPLGPNPRVGCVLLAPEGTVLAEGYHRGAGTDHAEADALANATTDLTGATAVVTLEPCTHVGRTGPCAEALIEAGIARVVIARRDPDLVAGGGLERLREAGVEVEMVSEPEILAGAEALNRGWEHGLRHGRPLVTVKSALTLDGRAAAADGTSRWITSSAARTEVHRLRSNCDAVIVGAGTARVDRPTLTARRDDGTLRPRQPLRAVMGAGSVPELPAIAGAGPALHLRTRRPSAALETLFDRGIRHVLLEGGPSLIAAFLRAGLVDEMIIHMAPTLLGSGTPGIADLGITTLADRIDLELVSAEPLGPDLRLVLRPRAA